MVPRRCPPAAPTGAIAAACAGDDLAAAASRPRSLSAAPSSLPGPSSPLAATASVLKLRGPARCLRARAAAGSPPPGTPSPCFLCPGSHSVGSPGFLALPGPSRRARRVRTPWEPRRGFRTSPLGSPSLRSRPIPERVPSRPPARVLSKSVSRAPVSLRGPPGAAPPALRKPRLRRPWLSFASLSPQARGLQRLAQPPAPARAEDGGRAAWAPQVWTGLCARRVQAETSRP